MNGWRTAGILADLWDAYASVHTPRGYRAPKYPRPVTKSKSSADRYGADPIPVSSFDGWYNRKE